MAYCENCGTRGIDPRKMVGDATRNLLVGPCCAENVKEAKVTVLPPVGEEQNEFGFTLSSDFGVITARRFTHLASDVIEAAAA